MSAAPSSRRKHGISSWRRWIAFHVRDSGIGIHPDHMDRIFSPFVQTEQRHTRRYDGTGLGLTISRRLARLMRGHVTMESTVGDG